MNRTTKGQRIMNELDADYLGSHFGAISITLAKIERHRPDLHERLNPDIWSWTRQNVDEFAAASVQFFAWEQDVRNRLAIFIADALAAGDATGRVFVPVGLDEAVRADDLADIERLIGVAPTAA